MTHSTNFKPLQITKMLLITLYHVSFIWKGDYYEFSARLYPYRVSTSKLYQLNIQNISFGFNSCDCEYLILYQIISTDCNVYRHSIYMN